MNAERMQGMRNPVTCNAMMKLLCNEKERGGYKVNKKLHY